MIKLTYHRLWIGFASLVGLVTMACGGGQDPLTAENITLEECNEIFGEGDDTPATGGSDGTEEGDYDDDGDVDQDDEDIEVRCEELMAEENAK